MIEEFKKDGFSYEEIQEIKESIDDFEKTWASFDFKDVKTLARNNLFSKVKGCSK